MTAPRRSARERKANPKYLDTGWDKQTLRLLRESSESSGSSPSDDPVHQIESRDDDFGSPGPEHFAGHSSSGDHDGLSDTPSGSAIHTPIESDDDFVDVSARGPVIPRQIHAHAPRTVGGLSKHLGSGRSRGIHPIHRRSSKRVVYSQIFGPDIEDLKPILLARDSWLTPRDITLPSRLTLAESPSWSSLFDETSIQAHTVTHRVVDQIFIQQNFESIDLDSAKAANHLILNPSEQSVALGPVGLQRLCNIGYLQAFDTWLAWANPTSSQSTEADQSSHSLPDKAVTADDRGCMLNVGEKVQCLAWLPGNDSSHQILAIACRSTSKQRSVNLAAPFTRPPAFYASSSYPSSIQVWAFGTVESEQHENSVPSRCAVGPPLLKTLYGVDTGDIRQLQWQPTTTSHATKLLAVLSSDGFVRLLAMNLSQADLPRTEYVRINTPGSIIPSPSDAIFTTMCWASVSDIVLGSSDGAIHVYDILNSIQNPTTLRPYLSHRLHATYIMSVVSAIPSDNPTIIASTSASGDLLLTDLRAPDQDRVHVQKARLPTKPLIYSSATRSFISVTDTGGTSDARGMSASLILCHPLRHFYGNLQICHLPEMSGAATSLAGSVHHPCILIGNAKGSVFATNYLRQVLPVQAKNPEMRGFLQTICEYDWRPMSPSAKSANNESTGKDKDWPEEAKIDLFHGHDVRPGISRFTEGFKPDLIDLSSGGTRHRRRPPAKTAAGSGETPKVKNSGVKRKMKLRDAAGSAAEVVFEEEQAVTALEWNPNRRCAGWAAMGWGSGIVRVMDLSHDAK